MMVYIIFIQYSYDDGFEIAQIYLNKEKAIAQCEYLKSKKAPFMTYWVEEKEITE